MRVATSLQVLAIWGAVAGSRLLGVAATCNGQSSTDVATMDPSNTAYSGTPYCSSYHPELPASQKFCSTGNQAGSINWSAGASLFSPSTVTLSCSTHVVIDYFKLSYYDSNASDKPISFNPAANAGPGYATPLSPGQCWDSQAINPQGGSTTSFSVTFGGPTNGFLWEFAMYCYQPPTPAPTAASTTSASTASATPAPVTTSNTGASSTTSASVMTWTNEHCSGTPQAAVKTTAGQCQSLSGVYGMLQCSSSSQSSAWTLSVYTGSSGGCTGSSTSVSGSGLQCVDIGSGLGGMAVDCSGVDTTYATSGSSAAHAPLALVAAATVGVAAALVM